MGLGGALRHAHRGVDAHGRRLRRHRRALTSVLYGRPLDPNGDYYARLADSNAVSTLNATALSGVLGMTLDGMLPAEEESAPESAPASESGSVSAASAAD